MPSRQSTCVTAFAALSALASGASAYETWPASDMQLLVDVQAFTRFAGSQYQQTGDTFALLDTNSTGSYQALGLGFDLEFGLFDDVAIYTTTAFKRAQIKSEFGAATVSGIADFYLGGKWLAVDSAISLTLAPEVKFATGYTADAGPFMPVLGNGVNEYAARIWLGKRFADAPFYFEVGSGYRFRGTRIPRGGGPKLIYNDEIPYDLEVGFWFTRAVAAHAFVDGVVGLGAPDTISSIELAPLTQSYTHVGGGITYRINPAVRLLGQYRTTVAGTNALNAQFIGLSANFSYGF